MRSAFNVAFQNKKWAFFSVSGAVALVVLLTYWPVMHAGFVWEDILYFQNTAWLGQENSWQQLLFKNFNGWVNYFRPLVVGLFAIEVRSFHATPGPMHAVSLGLHLINNFLVGLLAFRFVVNKDAKAPSWWVLALPMLLYGLHPVLIEPVTWIGCQADLLATFFMLLGILTNTWIRYPLGRSIGVAGFFFLAACSKESAAAFPLILIVFDWFALAVPRDAKLPFQLKTLLTRQGLTYASIFVAGVFYLLFRHWALGSLSLRTGDDALPLLARLQQACYIYLHYWRTLFWPMQGMGPVHPIHIDQFFAIDALSVLRDMAAFTIIIAGMALTLRRVALGGLILIITFSLLPVLHIVPGNLDRSLYHERYVMTGLAMVCAWLPIVLRDISIPIAVQRIVAGSATAILVFWLLLSVLNIRQTIPLWSTQVSLWEWALQENPGYIEAEDGLILGYMNMGADAKAWQIIDTVVAQNVPCVNCMLNASVLALGEHDVNRAAFFLDRAKQMPNLRAQDSAYDLYLSARGELLLLQGNPAAAEQVVRQAISIDSLDPHPQMVLARSLALQGKFAEAKQADDAAIQLLAPAMRERRRQYFDMLLRSIENASGKEKPNGSQNLQ